jgi:hypothetical protein
MAGRPRNLADDSARARAGRSLGDAEMTATALTFPRLPNRWLTETRAAFRAYERSETAKALRAEDVPAVMRLFEYLDALTKRWELMQRRADDAFSNGTAATLDEREAIAVIRQLEGMVITLAAALGVGPRARQSLGIKTEHRPGSRLDAFRASGE